MTIKCFKLQLIMRNSWMSNLQISDKLIFCLETGTWSSLEEVVQKSSNPKQKLDLILNLKQNAPLQTDNRKHIFWPNPKMTGLINTIEEPQLHEISTELKKKIENAPGIRASPCKIQANTSIVNFTAISLIIIIGFYLVACTLAPLVNLNNQTFKLIFTFVGEIPSILFIKKSD